MGLMAATEGRALNNQRAHLACNGSNSSRFRGAVLNHSDGRRARGRTRAHLLSGTSSFALSVASMIVALGVCATDDAQAQTTVNPVQTTTFTLTAAQNPIIFGSATNIDTSVGTATNAVNGGINTAWDVTNNGTLIGAHIGDFLAGAGSRLANSKSISGNTDVGVQLLDGGTVINQVGGTISGLLQGIKVSSASSHVGNVTNAGTIDGSDSSFSQGIFLASGGTVTNLAGAKISGATGILIVTAAGTVTNAGTISGSGGANGSSLQFRGSGTNTLTLQTGSVLEGDAIGSTASGATNNLILVGGGTASNNFKNFDALSVEASGTWVWNNTSSIGSTAIMSGTLAVDGELTSQ